LIASYPESVELKLEMRPELHPQFQELPDGVSEFTFANLYLFRQDHHYRVSRLPENLLVIAGKDGQTPFFMLPFGLPERTLLDQLFSEFGSMKCVPEKMAGQLESMGFEVWEDRDNFDYLYSRQSLSELTGRKFHKKRNLIKAQLRCRSSRRGRKDATTPVTTRPPGRRWKKRSPCSCAAGFTTWKTARSPIPWAKKTLWEKASSFTLKKRSAATRVCGNLSTRRLPPSFPSSTTLLTANRTWEARDSGGPNTATSPSGTLKNTGCRPDRAACRRLSYALNLPECVLYLCQAGLFYRLLCSFHYIDNRCIFNFF